MHKETEFKRSGISCILDQTVRRQKLCYVTQVNIANHSKYWIVNWMFTATSSRKAQGLCFSYTGEKHYWLIWRGHMQGTKMKLGSGFKELSRWPWLFHPKVIWHFPISPERIISPCLFLCSLQTNATDKNVLHCIVHPIPENSTLRSVIYTTY